MNALRTAAFASAAASGVMGGVLFGFSSFVMPALRRLPASQAVAAMQAVNRTAPRALGLPLVVSGPGTAAVAAWALTRTDVAGTARTLLVTGAVTAVAAFAITAAYHVPRNDRLDTVDAMSEAAGLAWESFVPGWVSMNHARTALSLVSAGLVIAGAVRLP
ncbi:MAG TPA: anthrone oxygenase family protein [Intrasporangium sp.]|nr:anthrone oxygenase family protein [Intrasporangium sp.]